MHIQVDTDHAVLCCVRAAVTRTRRRHRFSTAAILYQVGAPQGPVLPDRRAPPLRQRPTADVRAQELTLPLRRAGYT